MKKAVALIAALAIAFCFVGCGKQETGKKQEVQKTLSIYCLSGPTGIGAANLWAKEKSNYNFTVATAPDQVAAQLINKKADIAVIPTNLAAVLYKKTEGQIKILAVNTLSVLHLIDTTGTVASIADLKGKEVYLTGKGSNPEYIFNYILTNNGIDPATDVTLHFATDGQELASLCATGTAKICVAPEPVATVIKTKVTVTGTLDLENEWEKVNKDSRIMMGCVVAQSELIENNKSAVDTFLKEYKESIESAKNDAEKTGTICEEKGIISPAAVVTKAIPNCGLTFITGSKMKKQLTEYFNVLFEADKTSIGGSMPDDDFWYAK